MIVKTTVFRLTRLRVIDRSAKILMRSIDVIEITQWEKNDSNGPLMGALKKDEADLGYYPSILTIERYADARVILQQWPTR